MNAAIKEIQKLNARIDSIVDQRGWTMNAARIRAMTEEFLRLQAERDRVELALYEAYGVTVER